MEEDGASLEEDQSVMGAIGRGRSGGRVQLRPVSCIRAEGGGGEVRKEAGASGRAEHCPLFSLCSRHVTTA